MTTWLPVPGYEGRYDVSDDGQVRSWLGSNGRPIPGLLTPYLNKRGYLQVCLSRPGGRETNAKVHVLMLLAFVGPRPDRMQTRHLDGDSTNNTLVNIVYGTASENQLDNVRHGTHPEARKTECPQGHPYDNENTHISREGNRHCRECNRIRGRRHYAAATQTNTGETR